MNANVIDLATWLNGGFPEPEPVEPFPLRDPDRPPPGYLRGARWNSGKGWARRTAWKTSCALTEHYDRMLEPNRKLITLFITQACIRGSDLLTLSINRTAKELSLAHGTTDRAFKRAIREGWIEVAEAGTPGKLKDGVNGKATVYRLLGTPSSPPSRKKVDGRPLRVRPQGGRKIQPDANDSTNHLTSGTGNPVSVRAVDNLALSRSEGVGTLVNENGGGLGTLENLMSHDFGTLEKDLYGDFGTLEIQPTSDWLAERLAAGADTSTQVIDDGVQIGYSRRSIFRAANDLGVIRDTIHGPSGGAKNPPKRVTTWWLPGTPRVRPPVHVDDDFDDFEEPEIARMVTAPGPRTAPRAAAAAEPEHMEQFLERPPSAEVRETTRMVTELCPHGHTWGMDCWWPE